MMKKIKREREKEKEKKRIRETKRNCRVELYRKKLASVSFTAKWNPRGQEKITWTTWLNRWLVIGPIADTPMLSIWASRRVSRCSFTSSPSSSWTSLCVYRSSGTSHWSCAPPYRPSSPYEYFSARQAGLNLTSQLIFVVVKYEFQ